MNSNLLSFLVCSWVFSRCFSSNAKKITQQLLFKNVVPWQLLSRHVKDVETTNNSNWEANLLYMELTQLEISRWVLVSWFQVSNISQIFLTFKQMGVSAIFPWTYFAQEKRFLIPVIFMHWEKHHAALVEQVKSVQDCSMVRRSPFWLNGP